ncbi:hypothetical protein MAPG_10782 [Magnaporthiopsis poae ATCC 64411]|uniref:Uncharacterized protein n=1 Tax=Magnaporthiopsis poae (strain ATCC 64411 / 73-15) TaxID=644358 RepID=A0A0C4EDI2_MAGP6|nr:hypothetical protein MAPG_10782 [Magnaporthiopsis poae ATCC 64411]
MSRLFGSITNRYRYARQPACVEELVEALTFAHYLRHQCLITHGETVTANAAAAKEKPKAKEREGGDTAMVDVDKQEEEASAEQKQPLTADDFLMGVFGLLGEIIRFATTTAARRRSRQRS